MSNLKGNRTAASNSSPFNRMNFFVENCIKNIVNTAIPVKVIAAHVKTDKAGYVDVLPLIESYDGFDNAIPSQTIFQVPYSRIQGGAAALIIDPVPGDIGLAVFSQQDITNLNAIPQKPLSKRCFSMADALYIGGFLNRQPSIFLELKQDNTANLVCPERLTIQTKTLDIECETMNVSASTAVNLHTPNTVISGNVSTGTGGAGGTFEINGTMNVSNDVTAGGISLKSHTHTAPDGETGTPH